MADNNQTPSNQDSNNSSNKPSPRKRRGWWWKLPLLLVLILVILVLLAPMILSTSPMRGFVVNKINDNLNGSVSIADWSIGWTSGIDVKDVKVFDEQRRLILEVGHLYSPISLVGAARGNIDLGDTRIENLNLTQLVIDEQGKTNYQKLVKAAPAEQPTKPTQPSRPEQAKPAALPNVHGTLTVSNLRGTIMVEPAKGAPAMEPLHLVDPSSIVVRIPNINSPIENAIQLVCRMGDASPGTIVLNGTTDAIENNQLQIAKLAADQKLEISNLDLAVAAPFLKMARVNAQTGGIANGSLQIKVAGMDSFSSTGQIEIANALFGGEVLKGDFFKSSRVNIPVNVSLQPVGGGNVVKVERVGIEFDQGTIALTGQVPQAALINLSQNKAPGQEGQLDLTASIDKLPALINSMPHTFQLMPGVKLTGGAFNLKSTVHLTPENVSLNTSYGLNGLAASRDGQPVGPLDPVTGSMQLIATPTGKPLPDIRDIVLNLQSPFATINGSGKTLSNLTISGQYDLKRLRADLGQLFAMNQIQDGRGKFTLTTTGDLTRVASPITAHFNLESRDLQLLMPADPKPVVLDQPRIVADCSLDLIRAEDQSKMAIRNLIFTLQTGPEQSPTIDVKLGANANFKQKPTDVSTSTTTPAALTLGGVRFVVQKFNVNLPQAQTEFAPFLQALLKSQIKIVGGVLSISAAGNFDASAFSLMTDKPVQISLANLTLHKADKVVLDNQALDVTTAGTIKLPPGGIDAALSALSITTSDNLLALQKASDGDLTLKLLPGNQFQANGALSFSANLAQANQLMQAFSGAPAPSSQAGQLRSGTLTGKLTFAPADPTSTSVNADMTVDMSLATYQQPINEKLTLASHSTVLNDFSSLVTNLDINSSFITTQIHDAQIILAQKKDGQVVTPSLFDMVPKAKVDIRFADLPKAMTIAQAFIPPVPVKGSDVVTGEPLQLLTGSAAISTSIARTNQQTTFNSQIALDDISFRRGDVTYTAKNKSNTFNLATAIDTTSAPANAPIAQQIQKLQITQLAGDLDVGKLTMTQPIVIGDLPAMLNLLAGKPGQAPPTLAGAFQLSGEISRVTTLLEALQGKQPGQLYPVAGQYSLTQSASAQGNRLSLAGKISASQFKVFQGQQVAFAEDQLDLNNDVAFDAGTNTLAINQFGLDMRSSDALHLSTTGKIVGVGAQQRFENLQLKFTPDYAKLWTIIQPLMTPQQKQQIGELSLAGKQESVFLINGQYPASKPFPAAIKSLNLQGVLAVPTVDWKSKGLKLSNLAIPVTGEKGVFVIATRTDKGMELPVPADCNGGKINLGGISMDLGQEHPLLNTPDNLQLLQHVALNSILSGVIGNLVGPILVDPKEASGFLDLAVVKCNQLPLDATMMAANDGIAQIKFSLTQLHIANGFAGILGGLISTGESGGLNGKITDGTVTLENGVVSPDFTLDIGSYGIGFSGKMSLADQRLLPMYVTVPPSALRKINRDLVKYVGNEGIAIPMTGTASNPKLEADKLISNLVQSAVQKQLQDRFLGGTQSPTPGANPPAQGGQDANKPPADNGLGGLIDMFKKKKK